MKVQLSSTELAMSELVTLLLLYKVVHNMCRSMDVQLAGANRHRARDGTTKMGGLTCAGTGAPSAGSRSICLAVATLMVLVLLHRCYWLFT